MVIANISGDHYSLGIIDYEFEGKIDLAFNRLDCAMLLPDAACMLKQPAGAGCAQQEIDIGTGQVRPHKVLLRLGPFSLVKQPAAFVDSRLLLALAQYAALDTDDLGFEADALACIEGCGAGSLKGQ